LNQVITLIIGATYAPSSGAGVATAGMAARRARRAWRAWRPAAIMAAMGNMERLEQIVARLPQAERVDVAEWGDHPTFRVNGKNFVFSDQAAQQLTVKLPKEEAAAVVATDPTAEPSGYGLGRHGWVSFTLAEPADAERWQQVEEWVRTSYVLVAPKKLARQVEAEDEAASA
jgi:predicted DNA-binding protein (MmcQ/YjbR family)